VSKQQKAASHGEIRCRAHGNGRGLGARRQGASAPPRATRILEFPPDNFSNFQFLAIFPLDFHLFVLSKIIIGPSPRRDPAPRTVQNTPKIPPLHPARKTKYETAWETPDVHENAQILLREIRPAASRGLDQSSHGL